MNILNLRRVEFEFAHLFFHPIQKLYKSFIIHLLIRKIFSIIKQCIGCNRCRSILCFFFRFQSGCLKRNPSFPGNFKKHRNILCIKRTLIGIVQYIACLLNVWMLRTLLKFRLSPLPGNEIQSPMAQVILGGLLSSTLLNGFVVPIVYFLLNRKKEASIVTPQEIQADL